MGSCRAVEQRRHFPFPFISISRKPCGFSEGIGARCSRPGSLYGYFGLHVHLHGCACEICGVLTLTAAGADEISRGLLADLGCLDGWVDGWMACRLLGRAAGRPSRQPVEGWVVSWLAG
jgi:hypothetical protein